MEARKLAKSESKPGDEDAMYESSEKHE